jgi:hypothetical protein
LGDEIRFSTFPHLKQFNQLQVSLSAAAVHKR